jgi:hypothetical protein
MAWNMTAHPCDGGTVDGTGVAQLLPLLAVNLFHVF